MNATRFTRWFIYFLIGAAIIAILWNADNNNAPAQEISISQLAQEIKADQISDIEVSSDRQQITVRFVDENRSPVQSQISGTSSLEELLAIYGITETDYSNGRPNIIYLPPITARVAASEIERTEGPVGMVVKVAMRPVKGVEP